MKKIFNRKFLTTFLIVLIVIVGLILTGTFIGKILPFIGTMRKSSLPNEYNGYEGLPEFSVVSDTEKRVYSPSNSESGLKLIRKGNLTLEVEKGKFYETLNKLISQVDQFNGNLINSQIYEEDGKNSGYLTFMVPSKSFNDFINKMSDFGKVKSLSISTQDVSEEYFDLEGRLKILESQRTLLLSWLDKAKDIKDLLSIRSELQNIESEIEKIKGRINYINYHSDFSEISILLEERSEIVPIWKKSDILRKIIDGLTFAFKSIINSLIYLIIFLAIVLPWFLFGYAIYFFIKNYILKKRDK